MKPARRLVTAAAVAVLALALVAGPAAAKKAPKGQFTYYATIDCGSGPIEVGSTDDLWAPLVDVQSGKKYTPVAWHVTFAGGSLDENKKGEPKKHAVDCSYDDGVATGTVTVKRA
jgi:hypothetical protein